MTVDYVRKEYPKEFQEIYKIYGPKTKTSSGKNNKKSSTTKKTE